MTNVQFISLVISSLLLVTSFLYKNNKLILLSLFFGSFLMGCFFALLDPYLVLWDEQFHALVAKHLSEDFFNPVLYKEALLPYDYKNWSSNYIWLHKQPLFLWQMALSIKLFGCTEIAVRLPSIIMHAFLSLIIFRMGCILFKKNVGILSAILFSFNNYILELVCGKYGTDHNDIAFLFYVTASMWALLEYKYTKKNNWLYLLGLFSGGAILVKWLVGLVVYLCWIIAAGLDKNKDIKSEFRLFIKAISITIIIALPWQIYCFYHFPLESKYELNYNSHHLFTAIEGHDGSILFYWDVLKRYYGEGDLVPYLILICTVFGLYKIKEKSIKISSLVFISSVYFFYTIASTKMTSYCLICAPFIFIFIAYSIQYLFDYLFSKLKYDLLKRVLYLSVVILMSFLMLNYAEVIFEHSIQKQHNGTARETDIYATTITKNISEELGEGKYVVFNVSITPFGYIPFMFYTNYIAYGFIPTSEDCKVIRSKGYRIAILKHNPLPDYIEKDSSVVKLNY